MAELQYTVFESAAEVAHGDPIQEGVITISGSSAQGAVINGTGRVRRRVRIHVDTNAYVTWGTNPTALTNGSGGRKMGAENPEYFDIEAGHKIAVIQRV